MLTLLGVLLAIPPSLSNARLRCEFGPRGLVALTDVARHAVYRLTQDEFRLTIGGTSYNSRGLPEPTSTTSRTSPTSITYRWAAGPYHVDVVYELRPAWGFVSKQLFVTGGGAAGYHVDEVTVLDAALAATVRDAYVPRSQHTSLGTGDYGGTLRSAGSRGLLAVVQNPFLEFRRDGNAFAIRYQPDMDWRAEYGPFASDRGLLAPLRLSGRYVPAQMLPEWRLGPADTTPGMDEAEVEAFTEMVRTFLIHPPAHPLNIFVGWTANDYQIDVATPAGQEEYRRVLDRVAGARTGRFDAPVREPGRAGAAGLADRQAGGVLPAHRHRRLRVRPHLSHLRRHQPLRTVVGVAAGDGGAEATRAGDRDRRPPGVPELWPVELAGGELSASHVYRRAAGEFRAVSRSLVRPRVRRPRALHGVPLPAVRVRAR